MKLYPTVKGLSAENKLSNGHSQQNDILLEACRGDFEVPELRRQRFY